MMKGSSVSAAFPTTWEISNDLNDLTACTNNISQVSSRFGQNNDYNEDKTTFGLMRKKAGRAHDKLLGKNVGYWQEKKPRAGGLKNNLSIVNSGLIPDNLASLLISEQKT